MPKFNSDEAHKDAARFVEVFQTYARIKIKSNRIFKQDLYAWVDVEDAEKCKKYRWYVRYKQAGINRGWVVYTFVKAPGLYGGIRELYLHRYVLDSPYGKGQDLVSFWRNNPLDCRKKNLLNKKRIIFRRKIFRAFINTRRYISSANWKVIMRARSAREKEKENERLKKEAFVPITKAIFQRVPGPSAPPDIFGEGLRISQK